MTRSSLNGIRYEGQYPCGEGVLYSDSLGIYIGHFERGIPNGVCTHYKKNGHRYYGEFKDGEYSGQGIQFWKSGRYASLISKRTLFWNGYDLVQKGVYLCRCLCKGKIDGDGILYIHKASGRKYYFMEGLFVDQKVCKRTLFNSYGSIFDGRREFHGRLSQRNSDMRFIPNWNYDIGMNS